KGAGKRDVRGPLIERNVDREAELVHAEVAADDRGVSAFAVDSAGDRAVLIHGELSRRFLGPFRRRVGEFPFSSDVAFRRPLGLLRFANLKSAAVDKNKFD